MITNVLEPGFKFRMKVVVLCVGNKAAASAVTAIGSAAVCYEKKYAIGVTMDDPVHGFGVFFAYGVEAFFRGDLGFAGTGNDLATDGVVGIVWMDEVKKVGRDGKGELLVGETATGAFIGV